MEHDSGKKRKPPSKEEDGVKDVLLRPFKEVAGGSVFSNLEENGSSTRKEKTTFTKVPCKIQQGAVSSRKILSFGCSICSDNLNYSPNDLLKHFEVTHKGILPTYPCDLCDFVTNEFPDLQRHRLEHRNTLVTCELCNNGVQYSLLMLTRHYLVSHSLNGQFFCDWCKFTTVDAGTFVQHIHHHNERPWKCSKCGNIELNEEDHKKHMKAHSEVFPCKCQFCGYGTMRSDHLKRHMVAVHKKEMYVNGTVDDGVTYLNLSTTARNLLKKTSESQEHQQVSKWNLLRESENSPNPNGRLIRRELASEENHKFNNSILAKRDLRSRTRTSSNADQSRQVVLKERDHQSSSDPSHSGSNGLKVVMVKNKISLPPNCTTKVMGFKMVDGKKHLVLRVISKTEVSSNSTSSVDEAISSTPKSSSCKSPVILENGEGSDSSSVTQSFVVSPKDCSSLLAEDEVMAVKVKTEEEETMVCNFDSNLHFVDDCRSANRSQSPLTNEYEKSHSHSGQIACLEKGQLDNPPNSAAVNTCASSVDTPGCSHNSLGPDSIRQNVSGEDANDLSVSSGAWTQQKSPEALEVTDITEFKNKSKPIVTSHLSSSSSSFNALDQKVSSSGMANVSEEVFSFHNYSKEAIDTNKSAVRLSSHSGDAGFSESDLSSPEPVLERDEGADTRSSATNKSSACHDEGGECGDVSVEDNQETIFQDFNIIKVEEDSIPISRKDLSSGISSTSVVDSVKHKTDDTISQPSKDSTTSSNDSLKQAKTMFRILQLPEGNRPVLMRTAESHFAMPVQINSSPGFKLLTNSSNPQINISYMKPGNKQSSDSSEVTSNRDKRIGVWTSKVGAAEKGKPQKGTSSNHYLIKSSGLKGQVILSSASHANSTDKTAITPKTCFLLQSSVPLVQAQSSAGLRLASGQLPLNSGQVLAMPVSPTEKPGSTQTGRQRFLLRYISPSKSGEQLNQEPTLGPQGSHSSEGSANKVIYKLVKPAGSLLKSVSSTSSGDPVLFANGPQTKCFFLANKMNPNVNSTLKQMISVQKPGDLSNTQESAISAPRLIVKLKPCETEKPLLAPRSIRPPSQRKRHRTTLFDEPPHAVQKSRRLANKALPDKDAAVSWTPIAKDVERTLRLAPFSSVQPLKCPRRYQPVVVLNHPDADIPEVVNIMKMVNRHRGAVTAVSLSKKTVQALSEHNAFEKSLKESGPSQRKGPTPRAVQSAVRERFVLKMKLRKKSRKKYEVVDTLSDGCVKPMTFECWFCGRLFNNQEDWIGHGQRHLMEATRDWNTLF
ncbi:zinc finger protein 518A [Neosynchiropus ocellatus]